MQDLLIESGNHELPKLYNSYQIIWQKNKNPTNKDTNNSKGFVNKSNTQNNNQQDDFNESVNRALDQTKDNINRSIQQSRNQIPHYNYIVNSYQEQTLQAVKEITENYIESKDNN